MEISRSCLPSFPSKAVIPVDLPEGTFAEKRGKGREIIALSVGRSASQFFPIRHIYFRPSDAVRWDCLVWPRQQIGSANREGRGKKRVRAKKKVNSDRPIQQGGQKKPHCVSLPKVTVCGFGS